MSNHAEALTVGTQVYRLADQCQHGAPQEIATVVGHTDNGVGGSLNDFYIREYGPGWVYRLRRVGGTGKGGQVHWHETNLKAV